MRTRSSLIIISLLMSLFPAVSAHAQLPFTYSFDKPLDAVSVRMEEDAPINVSAWDGGRWTPWQELHLENEQDPALRESNLVLFPRAVTRLRFTQAAKKEDIHPIRVSSAPVTFTVAATGPVEHRILSRNEWGADESLRVNTSSSSASSADTEIHEDAGTTVSPRVKDCEDAQARYPDEFKSSAPVRTTDRGERLRWPLTYSPSVKLLVVHHTAMLAAGEQRSGAERMRALYQYHSQNRGWGDIGYHYVIDDAGQIYEGRAGGDSVIGGHAYCNNTGTIGIAMMGNFDKEQPTQAQVTQLQWLLKILGEKYSLDMNRNVFFHGKSLSRIAGHRELVSTDCPGLAVWSALDQIRQHVRTGDTDADVTFPQMEPVPSANADISTPTQKIVTGKDGLASLSETVIEGRPGGEVIVPIFFRASARSYTANTRIARITRERTLAVAQEKNGTFVPVRGDVRLTVPLRKGESVLLRLKVTLPMNGGSSKLKVGSLNYTFEMSGRRVRSRQLINTRFGAEPLRENPVATGRVQLTQPASSSSASSASPVPARSTGPLIRILLTSPIPAGAKEAVLHTSADVRVNGTLFTRRDLALSVSGTSCIAAAGSQSITGSVVRLDPGEGTTTIGGREYRGLLECRVLDGVQTLINELPLESYLQGLAEEPDTEPFEKQRAFAIAARTYALYYLDPAHRKFPGKPYDGSDSPATFQVYRGYGFELGNPRWVKAVQDTARQVMTYDGTVIRPPYFSSDDGRTRTPAEAGWTNFPFAQIYASKPDPWCAGMPLAGHGVGMSGCGAEGQAEEGKRGEEILEYYYPGTKIERK